MGWLTAIWHDVECAAYTADLSVWRDLAEPGAALLDLGCGTGRVTLDLAARGSKVTALDSDPELIDALRKRSKEHDLQVEAVVADARDFDLGKTFPLVISPMQVVQLLGGPEGRAPMLDCVRRHLEPGGTFAVALANPFDDWDEEESLPPLPDVREENGWVYSSTPLAIRAGEASFLIDRHRQAVSPKGWLREELSTIELDALSADQLESEAAEHGYAVGARRKVPATREYVGSDVVILEAA